MNAITTISRRQDTRGFVHNASALHTTPPAHSKSRKWTFHLFRKADILTRQRQKGTLEPAILTAIEAPPRQGRINSFIATSRAKAFGWRGEGCCCWPEMPKRLRICDEMGW
jgi:hypothetical protein